jgi:hypothetical protein
LGTALMIFAMPGCSSTSSAPEAVMPSAPSGPLDGGCAPDCAGKVCGGDGCGGQCGVCPSDVSCGAGGACVPWSCALMCEGKTCGDDGCGGTCGACAEGEVCMPSVGICVVPDPCQGLTFEGCCQGPLLKWCEDGQLQAMECTGAGTCGWDLSTLGYDCEMEGLEDPSGVFPMDCGGACTCEDKACGDDGCGTTCGTCGEGEICDLLTGQCLENLCEGVTFEGCCDGETVTWCEDGELWITECDAEPLCGWDAAEGYYWCGTDGAPDPSGTLPKDCGF